MQSASSRRSLMMFPNIKQKKKVALQKQRIKELRFQVIQVEGHDISYLRGRRVQRPQAAYEVQEG
jgi:hypothetical protein